MKFLYITNPVKALKLNISYSRHNEYLILQFFLCVIVKAIAIATCSSWPSRFGQ
ncbi:MAG: hypothetical protein JWR67_2240 [Mucilaginibacter sp.]|nr:hypothetical protein [Mucilaginibacter sp.]